MYDIVIVGAGTAGLSAAIYAVRAGKKVLILEEKIYGGQIINTPKVENYPGIKQISGYEFATELYEQAIGLGAEFKIAKVTKIENRGDTKIVIAESDSEVLYECRSVILATGAKNRKLELENEKELTGRGVSYCATCDGAFFKGKDVAVIGGGNTALEDASFLASYCNRVYIIHRRDRFRGEEKATEELMNKPNVEMIMNSSVVSLNGQEMLESITVFSKDIQEERVIPVSGVFVAIGQIPGNEAFANMIDTDEIGYVKASEDCKTNVKGIFTAGDCRTKTVRQLTTAAADGAVAGLAACEFIL
jgi:thioredoxin reductase (NADPH)